MNDVNGKWIGYGLGDTGPQVVKIQHRLLKAYPKNSQALTLGVTESGTYDSATVQAVKNIQPFLSPPQGATGIANYATQVALGAYLPAPNLPPRFTFITVNGTGSPGPFDWGFSGEVGNALDPEVWYWQPCAYPAATFPMGPSVQAGRAEVNRQIALRPPGTPLGFSGYSQGALVIDTVWRDDILNPSGIHHDRLSDVLAITNFGDPMRAPGICRGNEHAGFPIPTPLDDTPTGGIAGSGDLTPDQTPDFLLSCNNDGDLYGAAPSGPGAGADEEVIYNIVQNFNADNIIAIAETVIPLLNPATDVTGLTAELPRLLIGLVGGDITSLPASANNSQIVGFLEALLNGAMFVQSGFGPHGDYEKMVPAMVDFVMKAGKNVA